MIILKWDQQPVKLLNRRVAFFFFFANELFRKEDMTKDSQRILLLSKKCDKDKADITKIANTEAIRCMPQSFKCLP